MRQFLQSTAAGANATAAAAAAATAAHRRSSSTSSILAAAAAGAAAASGGADGSLAVAVPRVQGVPHKELSPDSLWLLKMYGRVYLAHADAGTSRLELYRFYTDTIILEHVLELFSPEVCTVAVLERDGCHHHAGTCVDKVD
jgi:hypothetical protein